MRLGKERIVTACNASDKVGFEVPLSQRLVLTVPEAAAVAGLPPRVIRVAIASGDLCCCYAASSTVRVRRSDLEDYVQSLPEVCL